MSETRLVGVAIWRELHARKKAFLISTAIAATVVIAGLVTLALVIGEEPPRPVVGTLIEDTTRIGDEIGRQLGPEVGFEMAWFEGQREAEEALAGGELSALIVGPREVLWTDSTPSWLADAVASAMRNLYVEEVAASLDLEPADTERLLAPIDGRTLVVDERDTGVEVLATVSIIVMFGAILAYGQWIAYGVVEEKANRVAELVLGAVSPLQMLIAKLAGIGGLGLVQLVIVGTAALVTGRIAGVDMPPVTISTLAWLALWFILGYAFYGTLYAAAGSLATDTQEAGGYITPINILPITGYMVGVISISVGAETLPRVLSLIPFWTPLLMPARMARGSVAGWEIGLAVVLMVVFTLVMARFSARVYLGGITQATRSVGWRQAFRGGGDFAPTRKVPPSHHAGPAAGT